MHINEEEIRRKMAERAVQLPDGAKVPPLGQGTWYIGENKRTWAEEIRTLQRGIELGMTLIDTAEMYGDGASERLVGEAVKGMRDKVFIISKVYPHNSGCGKIQEACEKSLRRLGTDYLDLYLLHWRGMVPLPEVIEGMEKLKREGKILRWGVSNFDTDDMRELLKYKDGEHCAVNQVLYHLGSRGIEYDLVPWQEQHKIPVMAYSPLAHGGKLRKELFTNPVVLEFAEKKGFDPLQIVLAWSIRKGNTIAIPKASKIGHAEKNAAAVLIEFTEEELERLDRAFPAPDRKVPLDIL